MSTAQNTSSAGLGSSAENQAGSLVAVRMLAATLVVALCSYVYLGRNGRKKVSQSL
jgi:hypothetical protein